MSEHCNFIHIPEAILDKLSKKARKELGDAISNTKVEGTIEHRQHYDAHRYHTSHNPYMFDYHLLKIDDFKAEDAVQTIYRLSYEAKIAKLSAQKNEDAVSELKQIKDSMKLLKGVINE